MSQSFTVPAVTIAVAILLLSGCSATGPLKETEDPAPTAAASPTVPPETSPAESPPPDPVAEDEMWLEREQFIIDQQLPMDGSPLAAVTPEQKEFIAAQRAHVESQGIEWTPEAESLVLALTADACETAILSSHDVDIIGVVMHIGTSPLIDLLVPAGATEAERASVEMGAAGIMIYGMQYLCPADFPQWEEAYRELYPEAGW